MKTATMMAYWPVASPSRRFAAKRLACLLTAHHHGGVYGQCRLYPDDKGNRSEKAIRVCRVTVAGLPDVAGVRAAARLGGRHKREFSLRPVGTGNVIDGQIPGASRAAWETARSS